MTATTTGRRVTPTGTLLLPSTATREEWLAERRNGIGASEIPAIIGLSPYATALHIWAEKTGRLANDGPMHESAKWGLLLEDTVARTWADDNGYTVRRIGLIAHVEHPWRRASLDRLVMDGCDDGPCAVQIKTRSAYKAADYKDGIPDDVAAQVQWEMHVSGFTHTHVAVLIGGQTLVAHRLDADPQVQSYLIAEAERVWECVQADLPPEVDPAPSLLDLYDRLHPERVGAAELPPAAELWLNAYRDATAMEAEAKATKEKAKAALIGLLGDADTGLIDGRPVFTYREQVRKSFTVAESTSRTFRLTKGATS